MAKLRQMQLINCQSWKNNVITFGPSLNIIRSSENSVGKSVIFKFLKITCYPYEFDTDMRKELIRFGAEFAQITYLFDTGSCATVRVYPKRVVYFYTPAFQKIAFKSQPNTPFIEILRDLSVMVEPSSGFIANLIDSDRDLLLVNSNAKSNFNIVKILTQHERLTRMTSLFKEKIPIFKDNLTEVIKMQYKLEAQLQNLKYINVSELEDNVEELELYNDIFNPLLRIYESLTLLSSLNTDYQDFELLIDIVDFGIELENADLDSIDSSINNINDEDIELCDICVELENIISCYDGNIDVINDSDIEMLEFANFLEELNLSKLVSEVSIQDIYDKLDYVELVNDLIGVHNILGVLRTYQMRDKKLKQAVDKTLSGIKLIEPYISIENLLKELKNCIDIVDMLQSELNVLESQMSILINDNEIYECPIHGNIIYKDNSCIPILNIDRGR